MSLALLLVQVHQPGSGGQHGVRDRASRTLAGEPTDETGAALRRLARDGFDRLAAALPPALVS